MTDAAEAVGQHMQQEAAQELMSREGHDLGFVMMPVVLPAEADPAVIIKTDQAMIGDGDAVGAGLSRGGTRPPDRPAIATSPPKTEEQDAA